MMNQQLFVEKEPNENWTEDISSSFGKIIQGDCINVMDSLPSKSVDLIFADPPYNLQLKNALYRPDSSKVNAVNEAWDCFESFEEYDCFTHAWLKSARRVLKNTGALWVIGTYHNIFRVGTVLQNLGYWVLNDIVWHKSNPMPNFQGTRFTNAHETLLWCVRSAEQKSYVFNYTALKEMNEGLQMRSDDWFFPLCTGKERLKTQEGAKAHPTQKPEALLARIILACSNPEDVVLDPFLGSGTTAVVAKRLARQWIGIERNPEYILLARERVDAERQYCLSDLQTTPDRRKAPRVPFGLLVECGFLQVGDELVCSAGKRRAKIRVDGTLAYENTCGSIHQVASHIIQQPSCNGWDFWYYWDGDNLVSIDHLRERIREQMKNR